MLPFTQEDFDPQLEDALELFPEIVGDESVGVKLAINGLLSLTPDGNPIIGETPEVKGLWSAAAIWIKEAPGIAKTIAEWMTNGEPEIDPHGSDIARFYDHHKTAAAHRGPDQRGLQQDLRHRPPDGAVGLEPADPAVARPTTARSSWEPSSSRQPAGSAPTGTARTRRSSASTASGSCRAAAEWESRWWSPIINAEHLAMRDRAGMVDLSAFAIFDVTGPGALGVLERLCVNRVDVAAGRTVYTPLLNAAGGILADLTIMRLAHDRFRVVTGGGMGMRDQKIFAGRAARRRLGPAPRRDQRIHDGRAVGAARARHPRGRGRRQRRHQPRGLPVPDLEDRRHRRRADAGVADQLRRRARLGDLRPDRAGAPRLGRPVARPAGLTGSCRWGSATYAVDRAAGEGLPGARRRARARLQPGRGRDGPAQRQGRRLRRQGRLPPTARRAAGRDPVHADGRRSDVDERGQALHARPGADPVARRPAAGRWQGAPLVRDERRLRTVARQAPPHGLPAAGPGGRRATTCSSSTSASATR